jgi:hypothetical protein
MGQCQLIAIIYICTSLFPGQHGLDCYLLFPWIQKYLQIIGINRMFLNVATSRASL